MGRVPLLRRVADRSAAGRHDRGWFRCGSPCRKSPGRRFYRDPTRTCASTVAQRRRSGPGAQVGWTLQWLWRPAPSRGAVLHDLRDDGRLTR